MAAIKKCIERKELVQREIVAALVAMNGVMLMALLLPAALHGEFKLNKMVPAPWIFTGIQWLLQYLPPIWAGVLLPIGAASFFLVFPFLSRVWPALAKTLLWLTLTWSIILTLVGYFTIR